MHSTLFYSWQSDRPYSLNRNFIECVLKKALIKIGRDLECKSALREDELKVDKDTQGIPGTPEITETILNKISECSIFVPDLSFICKTDNDRFVPNPNVLIEYGWALKAIGLSRIVPVMNTAYGDPSHLPFDMRHLRWPITYYLTEETTQEEKKEIRAKLVSEFSNAITSIVTSGVLVESYSTMIENYMPAESTGNASFVRITNTGNTSTRVTFDFIDSVTGQPLANVTFPDEIQPQARRIFTSSEIESFLHVKFSPHERPRLRITGTNAPIMSHHYYQNYATGGVIESC